MNIDSKGKKFSVISFGNRKNTVLGSPTDEVKTEDGPVSTAIDDVVVPLDDDVEEEPEEGKLGLYEVSAPHSGLYSFIFIVLKFYATMESSSCALRVGRVDVDNTSRFHDILEFFRDFVKCQNLGLVLNQAKPPSSTRGC
ncbi:unnamed protein product [Schistocephalus solidus]|uniref:Uncharacterized protein n=1 Tax=Schistocephalus solidus TaxID=70667 RepID=A0A183TCG9_SCHSO|nr:unnamed protein product [Schistocephalus solidus]